MHKQAVSSNARATKIVIHKNENVLNMCITTHISTSTIIHLLDCKMQWG